MLQDLSHTLYETLLNAFPADKDYTVQAFSQQEMPASVAHFLRQTLTHRLQYEIDRLESPWFNYQTVKASVALHELQNALLETGAFPASEWAKALENAVGILLSYLVRPTHTLAGFVFGKNQEEIDTETLLRRMAYFQDYPYFQEILQVHLDRKALTELSKERFLDTLSQIDRLNLRHHNSLEERVSLLNPLFDLFAILSQSSVKIPTTLIAIFFQDKGEQDLYRRFLFLDQMRGLKQLSREEVARYLDSDTLASEQNAKEQSNTALAMPAPSHLVMPKEPLWKTFVAPDIAISSVAENAPQVAIESVETTNEVSKTETAETNSELAYFNKVNTKTTEVEAAEEEEVTPESVYAHMDGFNDEAITAQVEEEIEGEIEEQTEALMDETEFSQTEEIFLEIENTFPALIASEQDTDLVIPKEATASKKIPEEKTHTEILLEEDRIDELVAPLMSAATVASLPEASYDISIPLREEQRIDTLLHEKSERVNADAVVIETVSSPPISIPAPSAPSITHFQPSSLSRHQVLANQNGVSHPHASTVAQVSTLQSAPISKANPVNLVKVSPPKSVFGKETPQERLRAEIDAAENAALGVLHPERRAWFLRALFDQNIQLYHETMKRLSQARNWQEASQIIAVHLFLKQNIDIYSEPAVAFTDTVEARFRNK